MFQYLFFDEIEKGKLKKATFLSFFNPDNVFILMAISPKIQINLFYNTGPWSNTKFTWQSLLTLALPLGMHSL